MSVIENANRTPLDPGLMKRMMTCLAEMPAEQRGDLTGRGIGLIRFLEENVSSQGAFDRVSTLISFEFRMEALARLRKHPEYRAWAMKTDHRGAPDLIHEVLIETAALEQTNAGRNARRYCVRWKMSNEGALSNEYLMFLNG